MRILLLFIASIAIYFTACRKGFDFKRSGDAVTSELGKVVIYGSPCSGRVFFFDGYDMTFGNADSTGLFVVDSNWNIIDQQPDSLYSLK